MDVAEEIEKPSSKRKKFLLIGIVITVMLLIVGGIWWWQGKSHAVTENATVAGHIAPVSAKVTGTVIEVNFKEGQSVQKGQVLVRLDQTDYRIAVQQAQAALNVAKNQAEAASAQVGLTQGTTSNQVQESAAGVAQSQSGVGVAQQEVAVAQATVRQQQELIQTSRARVNAARAQMIEAENNLRRMRNLRQREFVSQADLDRAQATYDTARAQLDVAQQQVQEAQAAAAGAQARVAQARANVNQASSVVRQSQAALGRTQAQTQQVAVQRSQAQAQRSQIELAEAQLAQAKQQLAYTTIVAPISGTIGSKNVELGQVIQPNQPLFSVVPLENVWIEANYKETDLRGIRPGAPAEIEVDAYPSRKFKGVVETIAAATGSQFSMLPPENASGNFVKVVQWVPVRIRLTSSNPNRMLRPGMSVVVDIHRQD